MNLKSILSMLALHKKDFGGSFDDGVEAVICFVCSVSFYVCKPRNILLIA